MASSPSSGDTGGQPAASEAAQRLRCSFCGKRRDEVEGIVAAGRWKVAICNECVDLCTEIFAEQRVASGLSATGPPPAPGSPPSATHSQGVAAPTADQVSAFPALGRAGTSVDAAASIRSDILGVLYTPQQEWQVNPSLGRIVFGTRGAGFLLLIPGSGEICLVAADFGDGVHAGCGAAASVESDGLVEFGGGRPSGYRVRGVLPRGASEGSLALADGTVVQIG